LYFQYTEKGQKSHKKIESEDDLEGFGDLKEEDQKALKDLIAGKGEEEKEKKKGTKRKASDKKEKGEKKTEKKVRRSKDDDDETEAEDLDVYLVAESSAKSGQKFWSIRVRGEKACVKYGKVNGKPMVLEKEFDTPSVATKYAKRELKKKGRKGIYEVTEGRRG